MLTQEKIDKWFKRKEIEKYTEYKTDKRLSGDGKRFNYHKEKWYDYCICDYCRGAVKFFPQKNYEKEGGFVVLPSTLTGRESVQIVAHNRCIKPLTEELERFNYEKHRKVSNRV